MFRKFHFSIFQIILTGFAVTVLVGSFLLMLPVSSRSGSLTSFSDTLFTATSAVCVTGLVVQDTASYWSVFGQLVILALIQIGGMGVVTVATMLTVLTGRRIGLFQRSMMQESVAAPKVGGIVRLTGFIVRLTILFELLGALLLAPVFIRDFGPVKGIWYAVFHSISAFCNAGFDLMGARAPYSSLTSYVGNPVINLTIPLLIICGGLGFMTWEDFRTNGLHLQRFRMQSKVILSTTLLLILLPAVYFFLQEFREGPVSTRIMEAFFSSVSPRTAGFNTVDYGSMQDNGIALTIALMLIGGSPGSTAGGMKTTTFVVLLLVASAVFNRRPQAVVYRRGLQEETIHNAAAIFIMYVVLFLFSGMIISGVEGLPLQSCLFETASAIGTVGLTMGLTPGLGHLSRLILICLMFFGRVGGLTLIFAALPSRNTGNAQYPEERLTVG